MSFFTLHYIWKAPRGNRDRVRRPKRRQGGPPKTASDRFEPFLIRPDWRTGSKVRPGEGRVPGRKYPLKHFARHCRLMTKTPWPGAHGGEPVRHAPEICSQLFCTPLQSIDKNGGARHPWRRASTPAPGLHCRPLIALYKHICIYIYICAAGSVPPSQHPWHVFDVFTSRNLILTSDRRDPASICPDLQMI